MKMDQVCIVCGAAATRITEHRASGQSASVCSTAHARKWKRSVRAGKAGAKVAPSGAPIKGGYPETSGQLTFLGGKPVEGRGR